jgi:hypothetical protein
MAKTKHGIFRDMNAMNMSDTDAMTDKEREKLRMHASDADKKALKPKKAM